MGEESDPFAELTAKIVGAIASAGAITPSELPTLIRAVQETLKQAGGPAAQADQTPEKPTAAQIRDSITPDALISFLDGKPYQVLKRHLRAHGLSLSDYKIKFGLPDDYPATAPNYSAKRSALAHPAGPGRHAAKPTKL